MSQFKDQIEAGAALLDEKIPEWEGRQDLERLDLSNHSNCVLGQSEDINNYWATLQRLFPHMQSHGELFRVAIEHGFSCEHLSMQEYSQLTREWKQFITDRRGQKNVLA